MGGASLLLPFTSPIRSLPFHFFFLCILVSFPLTFVCSPFIRCRPLYLLTYHCNRISSCLPGCLLHLLLKNYDFLSTDISQGSVATRFGCGGIFTYGFVTNFLLSLTVKEVWKSVNIWWSYGQEVGVLFFLTHGIGPIYTVRRMRIQISVSHRQLWQKLSILLRRYAINNVLRRGFHLTGSQRVSEQFVSWLWSRRMWCLSFISAENSDAVLLFPTKHFRRI